MQEKIAIWYKKPFYDVFSSHKMECYNDFINEMMRIYGQTGIQRGGNLWLWVKKVLPLRIF